MVPLLWSAAGEDQSVPIVEWLATTASAIGEPVQFHGGAGIRWRFVENRLGSFEVRHGVVGHTFSRSVDPVVEESWFPGNSS